jgi:hypothetical protein
MRILKRKAIRLARRSAFRRAQERSPLFRHSEFLFLSPYAAHLQDAEVPDFRDFIRANVDKTRPSLEMGASHAPTISKKDGYNVHIVDHLDKAALVEKYAAHHKDTSLVEEVDSIWSGGDLLALFDGARFSAIVTSHVIEHMTDCLGFLKQCTRLLDDQGKLYFVVPDRRYCFDALHASSTPGKLLDDHRLARTRHSFQSFYNVFSQIRANGEMGWSQIPISRAIFNSGTPRHWIGEIERLASTPDYIDNHENYFTPCSFALLIEEFGFLGELDLHIDLITRARGAEFLVVIAKHARVQSADDFGKMKLALHLGMMQEDAEHARLFRPLFRRFGL